MNYHNKIKKAVGELERNQHIELKTTMNYIVDYLVKAINGEIKNYTPQQSDKPRKTIAANITSTFRNYTSQGKEYLLLKTDGKGDDGNQLTLFCFGLVERWDELTEESNCDFIVERGKNSSYILVDFIKNY